MSGNLLAITSSSPQVLYSAQLGTTADATVYTAAAATTVKITYGMLCNTTGTAATVSLGVCQTGQTAGAAHRVLSVYTLGAGDSLSLADYLDGVHLGPADFITANAGTASAITLVLSGIVST